MSRVVPFAFSVEKSTPAGKSTPAVLVALVTNYSYAIAACLSRFCDARAPSLCTALDSSLDGENMMMMMTMMMFLLLEMMMIPSSMMMMMMMMMGLLALCASIFSRPKASWSDLHLERVLHLQAPPPV